ncbi:GHMP kinase N terminal domain protein [Burkholderia cepacia]|nr:GHMP kinase N terminal domain protein [Burkholderia cepacia]
MIKTLTVPAVRFVSTDQQVEKHKLISEPLELNGTLDLHKAVYNYMIRNYNHGKPIPLELSTFCDAPAGSGLGSSSTLVVVMIKAFVELLNLPLDDYAIAQLAYRIERVDCGLAGGARTNTRRRSGVQLHGIL